MLTGHPASLPWSLPARSAGQQFTPSCARCFATSPLVAALGPACPPEGLRPPLLAALSIVLPLRKPHPPPPAPLHLPQQHGPGRLCSPVGPVSSPCAPLCVAEMLSQRSQETRGLAQRAFSSAGAPGLPWALLCQAPGPGRSPDLAASIPTNGRQTGCRHGRSSTVLVARGAGWHTSASGIVACSATRSG